MLESLFTDLEVPPIKRQKTARLGRYEGLQRQLAADTTDSSREFIDIDVPVMPTSNYNKAMWQIGNAVPPRLAEAIGQALTPSLNEIAAHGDETAELYKTGRRRQTASQLALIRERNRV